MCVGAPGEITIIGYYSRKKGRPVVRIDVQQKDFLSELRNMVSKLAVGEAPQLEIKPSKLIFFTEEIHSFTMKAVVYGSQRIKLRESNEGGIDVIWQARAGNWDNTLGLLDGLIDSAIPTSLDFGEPSDDAELEVAFRENRPNQWKTVQS